MTVPNVEGQFYPTQEELRDVGLRKLSYGAYRYGLNVNVLPGSEYHFRYTALAAMVTPAFANNKLALRALSPLDAAEEQLLELAEVHGVPTRPASPASGQVRVGVTGGAPVTIPDGFKCTAADGTQFAVSGPHTVSDLGLVDVAAIKGGFATNKATGDLVRWDSASIAKLKATATVAAPGLRGGNDADSVETVRGRLLTRLASPGGGGNWAFVRDTAENSSAAIAGAFVYPAAQGPGSTSVALVGATGDRTVSTTITNAAAAALVANVPGRTSWNVTTVQPEYVDVILSARLPLPVNANGQGGGWKDAAPWPNATSGAVKVDSYNSVTSTVTTSAASLGVLAVGARIAIWDFADEKLYEYTVQTATLSGTVLIAVVGGFLKDHTGAYISAGAENLASYCSEFLAAMRTVGPGEKTTATHLLPRAYRKPSPENTAPAVLSSRLPAMVTDEHAEIVSLEYAQRYATGTTATKTSPSVPSATTDAPYVLVLKHLAIIQAA